jgi:hypothetical protein
LIVAAACRHVAGLDRCAGDDGIPLVGSGCASNQGALYSRIDSVVLLSVPVDVVDAHHAPGVWRADPRRWRGIA